MNIDPRHHEEYDSRQVEAAYRVLIDIGQVLGSFRDCLVVVGVWVPDLLILEPEGPHIGSIDVDLALDADKLKDGRYQELLKLLLDTRRYRPGTKSFQLVTDVDLPDGGPPLLVEVEFLAPKGVKRRRGQPKLLENFRVLEADGCAVAFHSPQEIELTGKTPRGAMNTVQLRIASIPDFVVMKAHALAGRDKPKDAYDICYCLANFPLGLETLAEGWKGRRQEKDVVSAIEILYQKFGSVDAFGPAQVVEFLAPANREAGEIEARRAFELVQAFLKLLG